MTLTLTCTIPGALEARCSPNITVHDLVRVWTEVGRLRAEGDDGAAYSFDLEAISGWQVVA